MNDTLSLTPRQSEILAWIARHLKDKGAPPTRAELCLAFGFRSPNAAEQHLRALARKGAIELQAGLSRGIRLCVDSNILTDTDTASAVHRLPLIGRVAAGQPLLATEHVEGHYQVDALLFRPRADYLLRVHGESMRDAGIDDGDLLAVQRTPEARHGQIVVARIDDEVTVKLFERRGRRIRLLPANPDFSPIDITPQQSFHIEGRAVGVIRRTLPS